MVNRIIPEKLKQGDSVRIITPSRSMGILSENTKNTANFHFLEMGLKITFGKYIDEMDDFTSSSIKLRVEDLHKILCGFSDITALNNAIYTKTGLVTYSGPHYSTFGQQNYLEYTTDYFKKCLFQDKPFEIKPSFYWLDDE